MNWSRLIAELNAAGMTQAQIAAECRCEQPSISDIKRGVTSDPRYSIGVALVELHKRRVKRTARA